MQTCAAARHILIVDDHELVRVGLRTLVASLARGPAVPLSVLEAGSLDEALRLYQRHGDSIGLVLLDLRLPDAYGLSGLRSLLSRFPGAPVAVLSGDSDPALVREALKAGARAYLPKAAQLTGVMDYIRQWGPQEGAACTATASATGAQGPSDALRTVQTPSGESLCLTLRQAEILDAVVAGQSNREIALRAHLSEGTVKNHVSALLLMFGVRSRAQLISRLR